MENKSKQSKEIIELLEGYKNLGHRELDNGTRLIGHVPHVVPEAWLHYIDPPLTRNDLIYLEKQVAIRLSQNFRDFLRASNGLNIFSDTLFVRSGKLQATY